MTLRWAPDAIRIITGVLLLSIPAVFVPHLLGEMDQTFTLATLG